MAGGGFVKVDDGYSQIPWYRKRWFIVLGVILFAPVPLVIAATGDIYALRQGGVYKYSSSGKRAIIAVCAMFIVLGLSRLAGG